MVLKQRFLWAVFLAGLRVPIKHGGYVGYMGRHGKTWEDMGRYVGYMGRYGNIDGRTSIKM